MVGNQGGLILHTKWATIQEFGSLHLGEAEKMNNKIGCACKSVGQTALLPPTEKAGVKCILSPHPVPRYMFNTIQQ